MQINGKVLCIYHAACSDGLLAAWAVHRALGDEVEFVAASYGDALPNHLSAFEGEEFQMLDNMGRSGDLSDAAYVRFQELEKKKNYLRDRDVLIVDFSYPLATLRAVAAEARSVLVIDHHKTAREDLAQVPQPDEYMMPADWQTWVNYGGTIDRGKGNLAAIFDMERSGAGLTWDFLHPAGPGPGDVQLTRPRIIDLIEDRDLWRFKYGDESRAFHAVLMSYDISDLPAMFGRMNVWSNSANFNLWLGILAEGHAILRAQRQLVATIIAATRRTMRIAGHVVPIANVPHELASEAGHFLLTGFVYTEKENEAGFSATYSDGADGRRHFELRSPEGGADVGKIAKEMVAWLNEQFKYNCPLGGFSGGGHKNASGFDAPLGWEGE